MDFVLSYVKNQNIRFPFKWTPIRRYLWEIALGSYFCKLCMKNFSPKKIFFFSDLHLINFMYVVVVTQNESRLTTIFYLLRLKIEFSRIK